MYIYIYLNGCYTKGIEDDESKFPEKLLIKFIRPTIKTE